MSQDIYKRPVRQIGGVFSMESAVAVISGGSGASAGQHALVQGVQWSYPREFRDIYEIGSADQFRVLGKARGSMNIARIVGTVLNVIDEQMFDACNIGATMTITASAQLCNGGGAKITYKFENVFVVDIGGAISVEDMMIRENVSMTFSGYNRN